MAARAASVGKARLHDNAWIFHASGAGPLHPFHSRLKGQTGANPAADPCSDPPTYPPQRSQRRCVWPQSPRMKLWSVLFALGFVATPGFAAIIGTNPPALPITADRIATLRASEQPAWRRYLA